MSKTEDKHCPECGKAAPCKRESIPRVVELDFDIMIAPFPLWRCTACGTLFCYENYTMIGTLGDQARRVKKEDQ